MGKVREYLMNTDVSVPRGVFWKALLSLVAFVIVVGGEMRIALAQDAQKVENLEVSVGKIETSVTAIEQDVGDALITQGRMQENLKNIEEDMDENKETMKDILKELRTNGT
jgi:hypothetical protein